MGPNGKRVVAVAVLLLAVTLGWLRVWYGAAPGPEPVPGAPGRPRNPAAEPGNPVTVDSVRRPDRPAAADPDAGEGGASAAPADAPDLPLPWEASPVVAFTEADLEAAGTGVTVLLENCMARVGEEFPVRVWLRAPALESMTLVMTYDPEMLEVIPGSAEPLERAICHGVEIYADQAKGKAIMIHSGTPGQRNFTASDGLAPLCGFRMRGKSAGTCALQVAAESSFTNGRGEEETVEGRDGRITIR